VDENIFYYTLSTIPQVVAAISAILAVFLFRRLEILKNLLIGDGTAILNRSAEGEYNFLFGKNEEESKERKKQDRRLRDGVNRKDISEVKNVISFYANKEKEADRRGIQTNKEKGLQFIYEKFCKTKELYDKIIFFSKVTFTVSIISILLSVTCLSLTKVIFLNFISVSTILVNLIVFIISILMTITVVIKSFK